MLGVPYMNRTDSIELSREAMGEMVARAQVGLLTCRCGHQQAEHSVVPRGPGCGRGAPLVVFGRCERCDVQACSRFIARRNASDRRALDTVTRAMIGFIHQRAIRYARKNPSLEVDEMVDEAFFGLYRAIEKWDPSFDTAFITYAAGWVENSIRRYSTGMMSLLSGSTHAMSKVHDGSFKRDLERLRAKGYTEDRVERAIAKQYRSTPGAIFAMKGLLHGTMASLDAEIPGSSANNGQPRTRHDFFASGAPSPEDAVADKEERDRLHAKLAKMTLEPRERAILYRRLMPADGEILTLEQLGQEFGGLTRERVRQIEKFLVRRIQAFLLDAPPPTHVKKPGPTDLVPPQLRTPKRRKKEGNVW